MIRKIKNTVCLLSVGLTMILTSGCVPLLVGAAAAGAGVAFVKGTMEANLDSSVAQVHKASLAAVKSLKLTVKEEEVLQHSAFVKAEYDDGTKAHISVEALTEKSSKIKVRIGVFGDETRSEVILSAIKKKL